MRDAVLGDPEDRFQIDCDDSFPMYVVGFQYGPIAVFPQDPGIVIEDVQGFVGLNALLYQTFDVGLKGYVTADRDRLASSRLYQLDGLVSGLAVDIGDDDAGPMLGEQQRGLASYPHACAGDQRDLAR